MVVLSFIPDLVRRLVAALFTAGFAGAALAAPDAALTLAPSAAWHLDYARDSCRLARTFGDGRNTAILVIDRFAPSHMVEVTVIGKPFATFRETGIPASLSFGPGLGAGPEQQVLKGASGKDRQPALFFGNVDLLNRPLSATRDHNPTVEEEAAITQVTVATPQRTVVLQSGSLKAPLAAMRACTDDLVIGWTGGAAPQDAGGEPAIPRDNPGQWLTTDDYPRHLLMLGARAIVHFRLNIAPTGLPTACSIQQSTNAPEFDALSCKLLMERARFMPARNSKGEPVASYFVSAVRWTIPHQAPER